MKIPRTFLYHATCPKGLIFDDEEEYKLAKSEGWVEAPYAVGKLEPPPPPEKPREIESPPEKHKKKPGRPSKK